MAAFNPSGRKRLFYGFTFKIRAKETPAVIDFVVAYGMKFDEGNDVEKLIKQASGTLLTRDGISSFLSSITIDDVDLPTIVNTLRERFDGHTLAVILLAAAASGKKLPAEIVGPTLSLLPTLTEFTALVGCCEGDLVDMFLRAVDSGHLSVQRESVALWYAARLSKGKPPDERLLAALRLACRSQLGGDTGLIIASAVDSVDDAHVKALAGPYLALLKAKEARTGEGLFDSFLATFEKPVLEMLPERELKISPISPFTVRRPAEKVGRNDPCPCGSGKKYKKCCHEKDLARLGNPSPVPGVTMDEYLENAHKYMSEEELGELRPHDIARLPFEEFTTPQLIAAKNQFVRFHMWEKAEVVLDLMARRVDLPDLIDNYRFDLIYDALENNEKDLFVRQTAKIENDEVLADLHIQRALMKPDERTLEVLNDEIENNLKTENSGTTIDIANALLDLYPGLGIVFARGVLDPNRSLDSDVLLETIERARDKLLLPPGDPSAEYYDFLLDRSVTQHVEDTFNRAHSAQIDTLTQKAADLQNELKTATERSAKLARELSARTRELEAADAQASSLKSLPSVSTAINPVPPSGEGTQVVRLQQKVSALKAYIEESRQEKSRLRTELAKMGEQFEKLSSKTDAAAYETKATEDDLEDETALPAFKEPLLPVFEKSATDAMAGLPRTVVVQSIKTAAAIAVGEQTGGIKVSRIKKTADLWSARVGIHHRMLFQISSAPCGELRVQYVIHRRDLEGVLKKLS